MDVNGSRYHLLHTEAEWRLQIGTGDDAELQWDVKQQGVTLQTQLFRFPARRGESRLQADDFRAADSDRYDTIYWIAEDQQSIYFMPAQNPVLSQYWHVKDMQQPCHHASDAVFKTRVQQLHTQDLRLSGLAVTADQYLLVGTLGDSGLLIFDLHAGGVPLWMQWPENLNVKVRDISVGSSGQIAILDVPDAAVGARVWMMDENFHIISLQAEALHTVSSVFKARDAAENTQQSYIEQREITEQMALQTDIIAALAVTVLPDASFLVLQAATDENASSVVHRYRSGNKTHAIILNTGIAGDALIHAHDFLFVGSAEQTDKQIQGLLYLCDEVGNQSFVFQLQISDMHFSLELNNQFYPMHGYSGQALLQTSKGVFYLMQKRWLPLLAQPQRRYFTEGAMHELLLDSEITACVWHRIILDACIPDDSSVIIQVRAAERREWLLQEQYVTQPALYLRHKGSELPIQKPRILEANVLDKQAQTGSWEVLIQQAKGRFLQLQISLQGNGRSSPVLYSLRTYYPRFSYLQQYMPAVYQDDQQAAHFLDRYLANVEGMFTEMEGRIAAIEHVFDSRSVPDDFLDWLASWLGVVLNTQWDEARQRLLLQFVMLLYRWRGTPVGLRAAITLAISVCPDESIFSELQALEANQNLSDAGFKVSPWEVRIVERFRLRSFSAQALGVPDNEDAPVLLDPGKLWTPAQGVAALDAIYHQYLQTITPATDAVETTYFPAVLPEQEEQAQRWRYFVQNYLDFYYAIVDGCNTQHVLRYREFLARRYKHINHYNQQYSADLGSFQQIYLPAKLPEQQIALNDWIEFVSSIMAIKQNAHLFTVLVPAYVNETNSLRQLRLQQSRAVVEQQKPAHCDFDVQLYWALFRVGSARLGLDSVLGESSRYVAMTLDQEYLGQSYVAAAHPFNERDRYVTGRERL